MMEKESRSKPISIVPKNVFGLRTDILGNVHFTTKQEIIYPVAGVLAVHDFTTNKQKFLRYQGITKVYLSYTNYCHNCRFPENYHPERIVISPDRKFIAVAEKSSDK